MNIMGKLDPLLSALAEDHVLPSTQAAANGAIIVVFAYLVPLLTMEINFFRLAVYKSWRRRVKVESRRASRAGSSRAASASLAEKVAPGGDDDGIASPAKGEADNRQEEKKEEEDVMIEDDDSSSSSAVGHLMNDVASALHETAALSNLSNRSLNSNNGKKASSRHSNSPSLQRAYDSIRTASMQAISSSLLVYSLTAVGISLSTRGLDEKVVAILIGASQFMTALMVFIISAKVPQWIGVYHEGAIRLVKCSSNYSSQFEHTDLDDPSVLKSLRSNVRLGVWFHFSKFYIILMPFYCGVQEATIPLSMVCGGVFGFILMWAVFVVHERYIQHRNIVSFMTILFLSVVSALTFVRGIAWMQVVWNLNLLENQDILMVISFFSWLGVLAAVHALFIWHTLRTEEGQSKSERTSDVDDGEDAALGDSRHSSGSCVPKKNPKVLRRNNSSYSSFVFDPRTHFTDGKCQFSEHPDVEEAFTVVSTEAPTDAPLQELQVIFSEESCDGQPLPSPHGSMEHDDSGFFNELEIDAIETPVAAATEDAAAANGLGTDSGAADDIDVGNTHDNHNGMDSPNRNEAIQTSSSKDGDSFEKNKRRRPAWCEVFICFSPEYQNGSCMWKFLCWIKIFLITLAYLLCIYFVIVSIGATTQINSTKAGLPAVHEALYNHMDEGPVCAFDNRGPESNITTFDDKEAAHAAGFLVVHCGACGACSNWENLIVEWTTRNNMASLANECAKKSFWGGGDDALTACLMEPEIGFGHDCAVCWMEDILCTKDHCAFIYLQAQMINNVGNFAVGPNEVTSANCEEAHCEVGQFVPCSGATRRRMNITSSISRPGDQQCRIVDVKDWEDLFFGSGVA